MHLKLSHKRIAEMTKEEILKHARQLRAKSTIMRKESVEIEKEARSLEIRVQKMV